MYRILWKVSGDPNTWIHDFHSPDAANAFWKELKKLPDVTWMGHDGPKKYNVVRVKFPRGSHEYTYLTDKVIEPGVLVVVNTVDGYQVLPVLFSGTMTEYELTKICSLERFKRIYGIVTPV